MKSKRFVGPMLLVLMVIGGLLAGNVSLAQDDPPSNIYDALRALNQKLGTQLQLTDLDNWYWTFEAYPTTGWECPQAFTEIRQEPSRAYKFNLVYQGVTYQYWQSQDLTDLFLCIPTGRENAGVFNPVSPIAPPPDSPFANCSVTPRLVVGQEGAVRTDEPAPNNIRSAPDPNSEKIGEIPVGERFRVLEGPVCGGEFTYWRIEYNGIQGWTAEGRRGEYYVRPFAPPPPPDYSDCAVQPRLVIGESGRVIVDPNATPNNIRRGPNSDADKLAEIPVGETFLVISGPVCSAESSFTWWRVEYNGVQGWTAEGSRNLGYFVEPAPAPTIGAPTGGSTAGVTSSGIPITTDFSTCPAYPYLQVGDVARVVGEVGVPNNVRAEPNPNTELIGEIPWDAVVNVLEGPVCTDRFTYWRVQYGDLIGWTAEGNATEYWLESIGRVQNMEGVSMLLDSRIADGWQVMPKTKTIGETTITNGLIILLEFNGTVIGVVIVDLANEYEMENPNTVAALRDSLSTRGAIPQTLYALSPEGEPIPAMSVQEAFLVGVNVQGWRHLTVNRDVNSDNFPPVFNPLSYFGYQLSLNSTYTYYVQSFFTVYSDTLPASLGEALAMYNLPEDTNSTEWLTFLDNIQFHYDETEALLAQGSDYTPQLEILDNMLKSITITNPALTFSCDTFISRLQPGMIARVTIGGGANNVRNQPSGSGELVGQIPEGESLQITGGAVCAEGYLWWPVRYQDLQGWTVEGDTNGYWVEPMP